jgi:hypothetical protein
VLAANRGQRMLNHDCTDTSKTHVGRVYEATFGRSLLIDPTTHAGVAVEKPETNGAPPGREVQCPTPRRPGYAYQRLVNNAHGDLVEDIRVPVVGTQVPFVYLKYRPPPMRFMHGSTVCKLGEVADVLTAVEMAQIIAMCRTLGVEYGEVDALRDRDNGALYVVDVNPTPWGPPIRLSKADRERAVTALAAAFSIEFL